MGDDAKWLCIGTVGMITAACVGAAVEQYVAASVAKTAMERGYHQVFDSRSGEVIWVPADEDPEAPAVSAEVQ